MQHQRLHRQRRHHQLLEPPRGGRLEGHVQGRRGYKDPHGGEEGVVVMTRGPGGRPSGERYTRECARPVVARGSAEVSQRTFCVAFESVTPGSRGSDSGCG